MKSQNFEFLRRGRAALAEAGAFAERYAYTDPAGSLFKQRSLVELLVADIYEAFRLPRPFGDNLNDLLRAEPFESAVPRVVLQKLHAVRMAGNDAVHHKRTITKELALDRLQQTFEIAQWFHLRVDRGSRADCPAYAVPTPESDGRSKTKEALEKQKQQAEAQFQALLAQLEEERRKRLAAEVAVEQTAEELARLKAEGEEVAKTLHFNELTTRRRLIDELLIHAGWDVGPNGQNTEQVRQEVQLAKVPSESGEGYADYVLYGDNGKPLAVVEAKKTAKDPTVGAEQARVYAVSLEKETGQRPVIFFTNGIDIYIWDDAQGYGWRKIYGFYSKDSLDYLIFQRANKLPLATVEPNMAIADRLYQLEAIKRVGERFSNKFRRALLVQATGTGKTRVAISLCDVLMRAGWAKRILFLCDRRELRKQADRTFKEHLPGEPRVVVDSSTSSDRDKRIYLATYPAMMKCYETFDVGFFDLIIADESHRSIYKKFRAPFQYFDALQVGLTATPIKFIERNTFELFGCENQDPTSQYSFTDAIEAKPPHLVPFRVRNYSSQFREQGLKYSQMSAAQRAELEDQEAVPENVEFEPEQVDRDVFNKGTTRFVLRTLMEEGIREATGSHVGKTIIFARNHKHAMHLAEVFQSLYPQYGGGFCQVIDNQISRAEQLIEDFKNPESEPVIAISVDMLDTGIDVPEVVNLVFAKPIRSYVKFWQMIGRGTRLRPHLFGPGKPKTEFMVFDHWSNFWFFDEEYVEKQEAPQRSLLQQLFEARVAVAEAALEAMNEPVFQATVDLLVEDIRAVQRARSIEVRDKWRELELLAERERIAQFAAVTKADLLSIAAPLMRWRDIRGDEEAYRFDLLVAKLEEAVLRKTPRVADLKARVEAQVELLMKNQTPVKAKAAAIEAVRSKKFWTGVTVPRLEEIRTELRGIMKYQQEKRVQSVGPKTVDVTDAELRGEDYIPKLEGLEFVEYKRRVEAVLREHFTQNATLQRIRTGKAVKDDELEELARLVLHVDDKANVKHLLGRQPEVQRTLLGVFRSLVGLDATAVEAAFKEFVKKYPRLSAQQLRFLQLLQNHIAQNGGIEIERLYEAPFTDVHAESVDGIFPRSEQVDEILAILETFQLKVASEPPSRRAS
ncbi:DEAD/DEAH box helicase family protein [Polyangium aurulentum]|uniref:DEAD/DEAH box helicase family protein n=1 Tax=Polyangium aurulentum TaxID=2567896 RepID=UPI00146C1C65|nr:DEAD/DEAH box helicase family protein [Polyangium aurulentum]UQA63258.1 DEAD/DEAH box helicase family protein [Polyangium aurulentum]